jgi:tripartite-type tricarboxylate transporter receptor subunit TctC
LPRLSFLLAVLLACAGGASAQSFPNGPVTVVVALAPGDAADISARTMAEDVSRRLNVPVLAVNRPGAGGAVAAASVVGAKKDGQTILFAPNSAVTFRPAVDPSAVSYDPQKDLLPLGISSRTPSVLAVRADAPYKTFAELIEHAKANPGKVNIGHPGAGSVGEFCIRLINTLANVDMVPVPYTGASPAVGALRGGQIDGVVLALGALGAQIKAGALRGLVSSNKAAEYPTIPTLREQGYKEDLFGVWLSYFAPAGIPDDARKALVAAIEEAIKSPATAAKLSAIGILQVYSSPGQQAAEIREEFKRVSEMLARAKAGK